MFQQYDLTLIDRSELIYHMYQKLIYMLFDLFFNQSHWFPTIDVNGFYY